MRIAERLKTLIWKFLENIITELGNILVTSLPSRNKNSTLVIKNHTKLDIKVSCSCPIFLYFFTLFQIFCLRL